MQEKRSHSMSTASNAVDPTAGRFVPLFEGFRSELDEHQDRRERVIKASRDITAASKKIIFALQRAKTTGSPLLDTIKRATKQHYETVQQCFQAVAPELQGVNAFRYSNISNGIQEYMEAIMFQHYLETQNLLSFDAASKHLQDLVGPSQTLRLSTEDYILGLFDATGEMMRFAITNLPTLNQTRTLNESTELAEQPRTVVDDLRRLRLLLCSMNFQGADGHFKRDANKKLEVTMASVEKVEKALYGLVVRGAERPSGWVPDVSDAQQSTVDSY